MVVVGGPKGLRLLSILVFPLLVLPGCATDASADKAGRKGSENTLFASYNSGDNPERYCEQQARITAGQVSAGCVHELIVFDRARRSCEASVADRRCISRNQQLWEQEVIKARGLVQQLAGDGFDEGSFHEQMRTQAERFAISCKQATDELVACDVK